MGTKTKLFRDKKEDVEDYCCPQHLVFQCDFQRFLSPFILILVFVEEEVVVAGVIGPDVFDAFVSLAFVFNLL